MSTRIDLRKNVYMEFKEILDSTNELIRTAQEMMAEINRKGAINPRSRNHEKAAAILFSEAFSRFLAVKLLCEDAMGNMSLLVLRSLLNLFIIFYWMLKVHKDARVKRYIGWYWKTMNDKIARNPSDYSADFRKGVRRQYGALRHLYTFKVKDKATGKFKKKRAKVWYSPWTIEKMAESVGLKGQYEDGYRILSLVEHVDPAHVLLKAKTGKIRYDPDFDKPILNESLVMNFSYFRKICEDIDNIFSLGKEKALKDFAERQRTFRRGVGKVGNPARS